MLSMITIAFVNRFTFQKETENSENTQHEICALGGKCWEVFGLKIVKRVGYHSTIDYLINLLLAH